MRRPVPSKHVRTYQDGNIYGLIIPYQHLWSGPIDLGTNTIHHRLWSPVVILDAATGDIRMHAVQRYYRGYDVRGLPDESEWSESVTILKLSPVYQRMLKWAKSAINAMHRGEIPSLTPRTDSSPASDPLTDRIRITAPKRLSKTIEHVGRTWTIEYRPLSPADTKMHSMQSIVELCEAALIAGYGDWNWPRFDLMLEVLTHDDSTRVMGKAIVNTDGTVDPPSAPRIISLSRRLLQGYDRGAVLRTILHELCHHAREELHPRVRTRTRSGFRAEEGHDKVFAEMMIASDPSLAQNPEQIEAFFEDIDPGSVVAERKAKAASKKVSSKGHFLIYRTKPGYIKIAWVPDRGRKIVRPLTVVAIDEIMSKMESPPPGHAPVILSDKDLVMLRTKYWPFAHDKVTWLEYLDAVVLKILR